MRNSDYEDFNIRFRGYEKEYIAEMLMEKDRLISLQERDVEALKREINYLKKQLNHSRRKKK